MENRNILKGLGEGIKKLRKEKEWSQEVLAEFTRYHWKTESFVHVSMEDSLNSRDSHR